MKKMIALLLAALMICAMFTGCGEKGTTLKSVQKAGKLTIATSPDFPPFESLGDNNEVVGIEIDVLNLICEQLGVTLEINQMDFDSVLPGVQAGKFDVGVSGIHRLLDHAEDIMTARCIVAVAGMEGALPSVIGGLADCPVIAVPTSVGYGAAFGGVAALLSMLNSCASGLSVVNIDNGFGAGYLASMINHLEGRK